MPRPAPANRSFSYNLIRMIPAQLLQGSLRAISRSAALAAGSLLAAAPGPTPLAQTAAPNPPSAHAPETQLDLSFKLNPQQKQQFADAGTAFNQHHFPEALALFQQLLAALPGDALLSKFAAEAALNTANTTLALTTLKPLVASDPDDWQAVALLVRACAEASDLSCRDAQMEHMQQLHRRRITPPNLLQYTVENLKVGDNLLTIATSLVPWGYYQIYDLGKLSDPSGNTFLRISIESNDADQGLFAKQHPQEAAQGTRGFSLDAYRDTGLNPAGQRTQTHYTFKFFVGQPTYATVRQEFLDIANGKTKPISSRTNLVLQP